MPERASGSHVWTSFGSADISPLTYRPPAYTAASSPASRRSPSPRHVLEASQHGHRHGHSFACGDLDFQPSSSSSSLNRPSPAVHSPARRMAEENANILTIALRRPTAEPAPPRRGKYVYHRQ